MLFGRPDALLFPEVLAPLRRAAGARRDGPVGEDEFEADVAAVRDERTARGRVGAAIESAGAGLGTLAAGILGTVRILQASPT